MKRSSLIFCLGAVTVVVAAGVGAINARPFFDDVLNHEKEASYATLADAKHGDGSLVPPSWVPNGVKNIHIKVKTDGPAQLLRFDLADGRLPASCVASDPHGAAPSVLQADWWPATMATKFGKKCGTWRVTVEETSVYAWQTHERFDQVPSAPVGS
ncbi:hypothetical protein [Streptomyces sioyaensis]|uniref:hypothetical protein n=1 Tax=Streptomyces sioyaensis TaxID=67364 RepID=UPI0036EE8D37